LSKNFSFFLILWLFKHWAIHLYKYKTDCSFSFVIQINSKKKLTTLVTLIYDWPWWWRQLLHILHTKKKENKSLVKRSNISHDIDMYTYTYMSSSIHHKQTLPRVHSYYICICASNNVDVTLIEYSILFLSSHFFLMLVFFFFSVFTWSSLCIYEMSQDTHII
jgi:hypothetical protein